MQSSAYLALIMLGWSEQVRPHATAALPVARVLSIEITVVPYS
jgi:hypothetical protein